jgi:hypothetical protein
MLDGSLATYGASTSSAKEAVKIKQSEQADMFTFYQGPICKVPRSMKKKE